MDDPIHFHLPDSDADDELPDIMNDPAFEPPTRRNTATSKYGSDGVGGETCRICRSEGTPDEPLFYPCKCSGSIKFVHQECLMEWLSHSHKKHCELCKTPFRFTKLYDANMPTTLPWSVFLSRACLHAARSLIRTARILLVAVVWLVVLPFLVRWAWRWMFWFADAGWARQTYILKMQASKGTPAIPVQQNGTASLSDSLYASFQHILGGSSDKDDVSPSGNTLGTIADGLTMIFQNATTKAKGQGETFFWPQTDASILTSWTYISELTPNPRLNRNILDIFEGQLITCVVITGFILLFLIREWVVQQQPLVNLMDNLNNQQERDRADQERRERARRQLELLEQARDRLERLQNEISTEHNEQGVLGEGTSQIPEFVGWEALSALIDSATEHLRAALNGRNEKGYDMFAVAAMDTLRQLRAAQQSDVNIADLTSKVFQKLSTLSRDERQAWEEVLIMELKNVDKRTTPAEHGSMVGASSHAIEDEDLPTSSTASRRPPMPNRDSSSRATQIQRLLEEADSAFALHDQHAPGTPSSGSIAVEPPTEAASVISASSTESSWQQISPPNEQSVPQQSEAVKRIDIFPGNNNEIPITNAGPDAKINIKRSGKQKVKPENSAHNEALSYLSDEQLKTLLTGSQPESENTTTIATASSPVDSQVVTGPQSDSNINNPFHPEGAEPEVQEPDSLRDRVADVLREEFGFGEAGQQANIPPADIYAHETDQHRDENSAEAGSHQAPQAPPDLLHRLADWFWGDIQVQGAAEPVIAPNEEVVADGDNAHEAHFAPVQNEHPVIENGPQVEPLQQNDPEVVAAAQQAGLDAEAIEDAEDLEGIFELIGLQGPLIGLFQTSCFCCVLVTATVIAAVGMPYVWGKLVLSFIGDPWAFCVKTPLQAASFIADLVIDITLVVAGWIMVVIAITFDIVCQFTFVDHWAPILTKHNILSWVSGVASTTALSAGHRLLQTFTSEPGVGEGLGWNWAFLTASAHAHSSLNGIKDEANVVLNYICNTITCTADTVSSGSAAVVWQQFVKMIASATVIPVYLTASLETFRLYTEPLLDILETLKSGALTFQRSQTVLDPSLVYWNSTDRSLAVLTGYLALAALAAVYVAVDKSISPYQAGQKVEKVVRDTLRQAGGVFKVILIISIEMLVFPLYCGMLLDLTFLPLFQGASVATRWGFAISAPYTFGFVHWFVGTCYMFHFALFVGMCRKILRKGVLWFIRDPDDPTFHPVRDVLERNVTTQLRKIAFSALVYGALVILCLGGVIWSIGKVFHGIFPIHWISTEPVLEFPLDLALYNFLTPLILRLSNPSTAINSMYAWWLRRCARWLRLSHFLFDDRRKDEEGRHVRRTWATLLLFRKGDPEEYIGPSDPRLAETDQLPEVYFKRDGKYVLTPCNDQYKPPKAGEAFLHDDEDDVYIADKDGKKNPHFAKVYVPPFFRLRVTVFMVCLWIFSAFTGLCATLVPLVFGRTIFSAILPQGTRVNDIYSYSVGVYILATAFFAVLKGNSGWRYIRDKFSNIDVKARANDVMRYGLQAAKCIYVYGFTYLVIPSIFALILQLYLVLPLHTYAVASLRPALASTANVSTNLTATASALLQGPSTEQSQMPSLADHSIHVLADYALCLIYLRITLRWIIQTPTSRAAEAVRRITADGYLNPNMRLATRFFILPALVVASILLLAPPGFITVAIMWVQFSHNRVIDEAAQVLLYRYSYPITAGTLLLIFGSVGLAKATSRWRGRIRDEVYLVGERLHNFGEKRPPVGSKSVVRKDK